MKGGYHQSPRLHASYQAEWQEDLQQWHWRAIWSGKMWLGGSKWRENNWTWRGWTIRRPNNRLKTGQLQEPGARWINDEYAQKPCIHHLQLINYFYIYKRRICGENVHTSGILQTQRIGSSVQGTEVDVSPQYKLVCPTGCQIFRQKKDTKAFHIWKQEILTLYSGFYPKSITLHCSWRQLRWASRTLYETRSIHEYIRKMAPVIADRWGGC